MMTGVKLAATGLAEVAIEVALGGKTVMEGNEDSVR